MMNTMNPLSFFTLPCTKVCNRRVVSMSKPEIVCSGHQNLYTLGKDSDVDPD